MTTEIAPGTPVVARFSEQSVPVEGTYLRHLPSGRHEVKFRALDPERGVETTFIHDFQTVTPTS